MGTSGFLCYNGDYRHMDEPCLYVDNRAFQFGDAISEEMHAYATESQFLQWHLDRLFAGMKLLAMEIPAYFTKERFDTYISKLLTKNRIFGGAHVRLIVFRNSSGFFVPEQNQVSFVMDCQKLDYNFYELNSRGYTINIFHDLTRCSNKFSLIKNASAHLFIAAAIHAKKNGLDDCILLNEKKKVVESVHSNIFLVKGTSIFTPGVNEGCIPGILRRAMIEICSKSGFRVNDQCSLSAQSLEDADEIFLTDVINGIRWVAAYNQKRYYKKTTQLLVQRLNEFAFYKWWNPG